MNTTETTLKEHLEEMTGLAVYSAVPCGMNYEEDGRYTMPARLEWLQNHAIEALKLAEKQEEALKAAKEALEQAVWALRCAAEETDDCRSPAGFWAKEAQKVQAALDQLNGK